MQDYINNLEGSVEIRGIAFLNKRNSVEINGRTELAFSFPANVVLTHEGAEDALRGGDRSGIKSLY